MKKQSTGGVNNRLGRTGFDRDGLHKAEDARAFSGEKKRMHWDRTAGALVVDGSPREKLAIAGVYTSPVIKCRFPATEFLPSWNVRLNDPAQGFRVYFRVSDRDGKASPWFFMGEGGAWDEAAKVKTEARGWGKTHIDYLALSKPAVAFQYKVEFITRGEPAMDKGGPELHAFYVHYSGTGKQSARLDGTAVGARANKLPVPYRSQLDVEKESLRHIICCPTCVAMVLEYYGADHKTLDVCNAAFDERHKIYGIWPRASQAAFHFGCRAWVTRFRTLQDVRATLTAGQPIIASIRVGEGELRGARYPKSNGHLIVITGFNGRDTLIVNDPYSAGQCGAEILYKADDIEKVWLDRGGVAILISNQKRK